MQVQPPQIDGPDRRPDIDNPESKDAHVDMTTAAHDCITGVLDLLDVVQRQQPACADREQLLTELAALTEAAEVIGEAPDTDPVVGADAREVALAARAAARALVGDARGRPLLAA